jgi:hypothetical protein
MNFLDNRVKKQSQAKEQIPLLLNESYCRSYQLAYDFIKRHAVGEGQLKRDSSIQAIISSVGSNG